MCTCCILIQITYFTYLLPLCSIQAVQTAACSVVALSSSVEGRCAKSFLCTSTIVISPFFNVIISISSWQVSYAHAYGHVTRLSQLLQSFDCQQHVHQPTHTAGHAVDLVITRNDTSVSHLRVGDFISDHALVSFKLDGVLKRPPAVCMLQRRAWRRCHSTRLPLTCRCLLCARIWTLLLICLLMPWPAPMSLF